MTVARDASTSALARPSHNPFFARMALVTLGLVAISFPVTYYKPLLVSAGAYPAEGVLHLPPLVHLHALFFFSWIFLYAWQTHLAVTGRVALHRELGLAGIAISAIMVPLGVGAVIVQARSNIAHGVADPFPLTFINLMGITTFAGLMTASIASVTRHREWHRRFTYGAALVLLQFAASRLFMPWWSYAYISYFILLLPDLVFLGALMLHDRKAWGRVHPATLWITAILLPLHAVAPTIAQSHAWDSIAPFVLHLAG